MACLLALFASGPAFAEPPPDAALRRRVAVLPVMNYAENSPETMWSQRKEDAPPEEVLERFLVKRLGVEPHLVVAPPAEVVERLKQIRVHREGAQLGLERMRLGRDLYKDLRVADAVPHLRQARAALSDAYYSLVDPKTMADLTLTLALCEMEAKRPHEAHVVLKELFLATPNRRFQTGFYSKDFEQALVSALTDFRATYPKENPFGTPAKRERFARDIDVDALVTAYIEPDAGGRSQVHITVYDRHTRSMAHRGAFDSAGRVKDLERIDRFVSRWTACLPTIVDERLPKGAEPEPVSAFFIDTSFVYSLYGSHASDQSPTRDPFHNFGMAVTAEWQFLSGLGAFLQGGMMISTDDPIRDLAKDVTTIRLAGGMSYAVAGRWWRVYARFGLEGQFLSEFETASQRWCKWAGPGHERCPDGDYNDFAPSRMLGFHAAVGFQAITSRSLYWTIRTGMSAYIVTTEDAPGLNFPAAFETGIGYKF